MKYMSEKTCAICGALFQGGPNARACPDCSPLYQRAYNSIIRHRAAIGDGSRETLRVAAIARVREMRRKPAPTPEPAPEVAPAQRRARCGYCGRELGPRDARRGYCSHCVAHGLHWVHEVTGRTAEGRR